MLDMTRYEEEQNDYIVDLKVNDDGNMVITYANGEVVEEKYTEHNYSFYRGKMVDQAIKYSDDAIKDLGIEWLKFEGIRYGLLLGGVVSMFFLYNVDIHVIIKIILAILVVLGEAVQLFFTQLGLASIEDDSIKAFAYNEYIKHLNNFRYYDNETGTIEYTLPIEDVDIHDMDQSFILKVNGVIEDMKEKGSEPKDMRVVYSKLKKPNTPKV